jgi:uroporphyrinogen III methyltransferase/synthase
LSADGGAARRGFVSLVGAGPGDPGLVTVAGVARIAEADVIVYDRLANPALLDHARADAGRIYVGKMPDRHTLTQDEINALLVEHGRAGMRVVRLKGGDPFVFGRGGEEAQALARADVPFEVIPGVTSAIAAPAYAGIPVTHRGLASSFAVVTGHEDPAKGGRGDRRVAWSAIDWAKLATGVDTLVLLMGVERLPEIAQQLMDHGRAADTPVAVVEWGTLPRQRTVSGTLATIASAVAAAGVGSPAVTVVGEVARLREDGPQGGLRWFDARPLSGKRVLVTRTRTQASELSRALAAAGAEPVELPALEIVRISDAREVARCVELLRTSAYGYVVFTSANAVEMFLEDVASAGLDARAFGRARVAAIGSSTAAALAQAGLRADLVPPEHVSESLAEELARRPVRGVRVLLPRATGARDVLVDALTARGAIVDELPLYEARVPQAPDAEGLRRLRDGEIDIATFASSSSVHNLIALLGGDVAPLRALTIAAIGPITAQTLRDYGLSVDVTPERHTIEGLVEALVEQERRASS